MFERGTVFIVGAGASYELGLPLGTVLMDNIEELLQYERGRFTDEVVHDAAVALARRRAGVNFGNELQGIIDAARRVVDALPFAVSIDNLLDAHRHDENMVEIGKVAITRAILAAESESNLQAFLSTRGRERQQAHLKQRISNFRASWYLPLVRLLNAGLPLADLETIFDNVSFITFNYDRCIEHFLMSGIRRYYAVDEARARETLKRVRVVHVYGQVGYLPWTPNVENLEAGFGDYKTPELVRIASQIQTFTESARSGLVEQAHSMIARARTLVFMGFGFLPQNMKVLAVEDTEAERVFLTTTGISDTDVEIVDEEIRAILNRRSEWSGRAGTIERIKLYIERGTCSDLMSNHWLRLTRQ